MIVVTILGIFGVIVGNVVGGGRGWNGSGEAAKQEALRHSKELGWEVQGVACTGVDSDQDGYISCTLVLEDGSERHLECASGGMTWTSGCKRAQVLPESPLE